MLQICAGNRHVNRKAALATLVFGVLSPDSAGHTILALVSRIICVSKLGSEV
jgi:hypothetical protein